MAAAKDGTGAQLAIPLEPKGIHDEMNSATFDEFGRMTANMGLEAPGITPLTQNIILYPYVNPATELLDSTGLPSSLDVTPIASAADGTQIWKITHNGVDTHPLHFHLYNVQVLNRVTWDNIIIPPDPSELGWKDTVRVSPLEDTIVAVRPIQPTLPFGVPDSKRPYNPMMPIGAKGSQNGPNGSEAGFNNTDALGAPIAPIDERRRRLRLGVRVALPHPQPRRDGHDAAGRCCTWPGRYRIAPVLSGTGTGPVNLSWTDGTPVNYANPATWPTALGTAEIGYRIERADVTGGVIGAYAQIGTCARQPDDLHGRHRGRRAPRTPTGSSRSMPPATQRPTPLASTFTLSGTVTAGGGGARREPSVHVFDAVTAAYFATTVTDGRRGLQPSASPPAPTSSSSSPTARPTPTSGYGGPDFAARHAAHPRPRHDRGDDRPGRRPPPSP